MSRTPSAHWVPETLNRRVPYTDKPFKQQHNPYEISLGNGHREISHLLEIIYDEVAPRIAKTKALRLLNEVLPGREAEAIQHGAFQALRPLLLQPPNGLLLHSLVCLDQLVDTMKDAQELAKDIPRIVEITHPDNEPPLRLAAATLLRHIAELIGPVKEFTEGEVPMRLVEATASPLSEKKLLLQLFDLLAKLTNVQSVREQLIGNKDALKVLVGSIKDADLRKTAVNLAENVAMDSTHRGKLALLEADVLDELGDVLAMREVSYRQSAISLISMLAVPKEGKERIAMARDIADALRNISETDADLLCRRSAYKARIIVAELPFGKVIVGDVVDPSKPVRKESSVEQEKEVTRANPQIGDKPVTFLLSPRSAGVIVKPRPDRKRQQKPASPAEGVTRAPLPALAPEEENQPEIRTREMPQEETVPDEKHESDHEVKQESDHEEKHESDHEEKKESDHSDKHESEHEDKQESDHEEKKESDHEEKQESDHEEKPESDHEEKKESDHEEKQESDHEEKHESDHEEKPESDHSEKKESDHSDKQESDHEEKQDSDHSDKQESDHSDKQESDHDDHSSHSDKDGSSDHDQGEENAADDAEEAPEDEAAADDDE